MSRFRLLLLQRREICDEVVDFFFREGGVGFHRRLTIRLRLGGHLWRGGDPLTDISGGHLRADIVQRSLFVAGSRNGMADTAFVVREQLLAMVGVALRERAAGPQAETDRNESDANHWLELLPRTLFNKRAAKISPRISHIRGRKREETPGNFSGVREISRGWRP